MGAHTSACCVLGREDVASDLGHERYGMEEAGEENIHQECALRQAEEASDRGVNFVMRNGRSP